MTMKGLEEGVADLILNEELIAVLKIAFHSLEGDCGKAFRDMCPATWQRMEAALSAASGRAPTNKEE